MAFRPPSATQTLTASGSVTAWGPIVLVNSAVAVTVTLPRGLASDTQKPTEIKNIGLGAVTVAAFAGDVLTGQSVLSQNTAVTYEVSSAGVIQSVSDIGAAAASTTLSYARITSYQTGSTAVNASSLAQISCASAANIAATPSAVGQRVPFTAANGTSSSATIGTNIVTIVNTGNYSIDAGVTMQTQGANTAMGLQLVKNGVVLNHMQGYPGGSGSAMVSIPVEWSGQLTAGDVVDLRLVSTSLASTINVHSVALNINELPTTTTVPAGSVTVTALNKFVARKDNATSQNIPTGVNTDVIFGVLSASVGSGYNSATGVFTSPSAGWYSFDAAVRMEYNTASAPQEMFILIVVNGVEKGRGAFAFTGTNANGTSFHYAQASVAVPLAIGDLVKVQCRQDTGFARVLNAADALNYFCGVEAATATVVDPGLVTPTALTQIEVTQTADQTTGLTVGSPVLFSSPATVGSIPFAAGVFTLGANKTYSLLGGVTLIVGTEMVFQWRDIGSGLLIGNSGNVLTNAAGRGVTASATVVTTAATTVRLEITSVNALTSINSGLGRGAWAKILELPVSTVVNPGTVPVNTLIYAYLRKDLGGANATTADLQAITVSGAANTTVVPPTTRRLSLTAPTTLDLSGVTVSSDQLVVSASGRYQVTAHIDYQTNSTVATARVNFFMVKGGASILDMTTAASETLNVDDQVTLLWEGALAAGDVLDFRGDGQVDFGYRGYAIQVRQLTTATVVQITPGALSAVTLGYASASSPSYVPTAVGDVPFTVVDASGLANTGTTFTLLAGKRYYMDARLGFNSNTGTASQIGYQIVRADNSVITGVSAGIWMNQVAQATGGGESPGSTGFFTPTVDTLVKVRVTSTSGPIAGASTSGIFLIQEQAVTNLVNPATVPVNTLMPAATVFDGAYVSATVGNIGHTNGAPFTPTVTGTYAVTVGGSAYSPAVGFSITNISLRQGATTLQGRSASIYMTAAGPHHQLTSKTFYQALTAGTTYNIYVVSGSNATIDAGDFWTVELEQLTTATVIVAGSVAAATAASDAAAGAAGYAPVTTVAGDNRKALFGDMTFRTVPTGYQTAAVYASGDLAYLGDELIRANAAVPAGTAFAWGTTGATWGAVMPLQSTDSPLTWLGVYAAGTTYAKGAVVAETSANTAALQVSQAAANTGNATTTGWWQPLHDGAIGHAMLGATAALAGIGGPAPTPAIGQQDRVLFGDGTWDFQGRKSVVQVANLATNGAVGTAAATVDVADELVLTQTTAAITATVPSPTTTTKYRTLTIQNKGTADILISATGFSQRLPAAGTLVAEWNGTAAWSLVACTPQAPTVQTFLVSGTYTPTPGMRYCEVYGVGAGGGGGGAAPGTAITMSMGFGGGAGAEADVRFTAAQIGASQAVTIGTGGAGGSGIAGSAGTVTSLGALITLNAGSGGSTTGAQAGPHASAGGAGGTATVSGGTTLRTKTGNNADPGYGMYYATTTLVSASPSNGGSSSYGAGGGGVAMFAAGSGASGGAGIAGTNRGGGGGGATSGGTGSVIRSGGTGANGQFVVHEFF